MNEEAGFVSAIEETPEDESLYLVFADWLEDRGDWRAPYLRLFAGPAEVSRFDDCFFVSWKSAGMSLRFASGSFECVFLYNHGADGFNEFRGELPCGLSFKQVRRDVQALLGLPDRTGGEGIIPYWEDFTRLGIHVSYDSSDVGDMNNRIHHIAVCPPEPAASPP